MERHRQRMHPLVEGAVKAVAEIGGKAIRRAVDSVMEDGQRAAEDLRHDIMNARSGFGGSRDSDTIDVPFEVRQVTPDPEDDMERARARTRRGAREDKDPEDPPPSGDVAELQELIEMRDAETFLRHGWMILAELADSGTYPKENAKELEELLGDLSDRIEDKEGVE